MTKNTGNTAGTATTGRTEKQGEQQNEQQAPSVLDNFRPLIVDVAVPLGSYYLFKNAFGMSTFAALAWSSVVPAVRTVWSLVKERRTNALAGLILFVNVVSLLLSFVAGDPRLMLAKDGAVSSTVGIGILVSVVLGRPMMSEGMKPFVLKGDPAKAAAWHRLTSGASVRSVAFRRKEMAFSLVWGVALLAECVMRVVGAYTVPIDTMVWLGTVLTVGTLALAFVVSGGLAVEPMEKMLAAEVEAAAEAEKAAVTVAA
ncbi:VC0807 family protein [Streptomyces sp. L2]|uniref:VC0807 family protein n=1 Tax=Streptomyces sp. L2 TaxID=2162665 RepID=UPI001F505B15|nr:VC0807 family protein [Streptomyces sp. L2]